MPLLFLATYILLAWLAAPDVLAFAMALTFGAVLLAFGWLAGSVSV